MPNIRDYSAPQGIGLSPSETGVEAIAGAARRTGQFYNQGAESLNEVAGLKNDEGRRVATTVTDGLEVAKDYEDHREISAGTAAGTALMAQKLTDWNALIKKADPNDPSTAQKFLTENLEPALQQFQSGFNTEASQKYAEQFSDQLRRDMFHKTAADMSSMAGIAAVQNAHSIQNNLATAVAADPSSLDSALKMADHSVISLVDSSPTIDPETGAKVKGQVLQEMKENIVKSAVTGMITKNPDTDLSVIEQRYGEFLKPGEVQQFQKAAQAQAKVNAYYDKQNALVAKQEADLKVHKDATTTLTNNMTTDPVTGKLIIKPQFFKDALNIARANPDAPSAAATARTMIDFGESQQNKEGKVTSDPQVKQDLTDRMFDPDHPTTRVDLMKASAAGKLSDHDFTTMERLTTELESAPLKGPVWQSTAAAVKDSLIVSVPGVPGKDNVGLQNYSTFMQTFVPQYLAKSRAGTLPPNALDTKDPTSMISQAMAPFRRSASDRMSDYVSQAGGIAAAPTERPAASRMVGDVPVPKALGGIADLQFNKSTMQWRDRASGKIYDRTGAPI